MEKSLTIKERFEAVMKNSFPALVFYHHIEEMKGKINVFFIEFTDGEALGETWEKVRNVVAVYYQNHLETDFERWNIYIIFVLPVNVFNGLKYKIENDQLSSRKIVVDNFEKTLDAKTRKELLSTYINNELNLTKSKDEHSKGALSYTSDSIVFAVMNTTNKGKKEKDQLRSLYDDLLNKLK